jgi:GNAT superfamily N-acetyltransferase
MSKEKPIKQTEKDEMQDSVMTLVQFQVSAAKPEDIDTVLGILDQATTWLQNKGLPTDWKPGEFLRQTFLEQISREEVHLGLIDGEPAGTFVLQWADPLWWGEQPPDAGYIHKLAIRPAFAGRGVGLEMLRWAEAKTKSLGKKFLRLNCMAEDRKIRDYYEKAGFTHLRDVPGTKALASLYEKTL